MPRKSKKAKFKPHKVQVNNYGEIFSNSGAVNGTSPIATLNYFFEIFSDRIDRDVIKLVLDECDFNGKLKYLHTFRNWSYNFN